MRRLEVSIVGVLPAWARLGDVARAGIAGFGHGVQGSWSGLRAPVIRRRRNLHLHSIENELCLYSPFHLVAGV